MTPKRGRPPKPATEKAKNQIGIRCTDQEYAAWKAASGAGELSEFVRGILNARAVAHFEESDTEERHGVLLRIPGSLLAKVDARARRENETRHALLLRLIEVGLEGEGHAREQLRRELRAALAGLL